jgi:hypothetical protein
MSLYKHLAVIFIPSWRLPWEVSIFYNIIIIIIIIIIITVVMMTDVGKTQLVVESLPFLYFCLTLPHREQEMCSRDSELDLSGSWL